MPHLKSSRPRPVRLAIGLGLALGLVIGAHAAGPPSNAALSVEAGLLLDRVRQSNDSKGMPFAIVDKKNARVHAFDRDGVLRGSSPVLLGLSKGDDSVPGIGDRKMADIKPEERTTPAGRFVAEPGRNLQGEDIVWVDYEAAVSMHRVRTANKADRRLARLATPTVADNRISYGCINVPAAFYDAHLRDALGKVGGVVYVLPETRPWTLQFKALGLPSRVPPT